MLGSHKQLVTNKLAMNANKWMESLPRVFDILQYLETILPSEESLGSSQKDEVCFMDGGAGMEACDVTNDGRHLGRHLRFYQELEIRLKPRGMELFCT